MAPAIHPPCTPSSSCHPVRCHPSLPVCSRPQACLARTTHLGKRPCQSAASIMASRSAASCGYCTKMTDPSGNQVGPEYFRKMKHIRRYLRRKAMERKMRKNDCLRGTNKYSKYERSKGRRAKTECCPGKGHRGRLKRERPRCCGMCSRICQERCQVCCDNCCCECCAQCCRLCCTIL